MMGETRRESNLVSVNDERSNGRLIRVRSDHRSGLVRDVEVELIRKRSSSEIERVSRRDVHDELSTIVHVESFVFSVGTGRNTSLYERGKDGAKSHLFTNTVMLTVPVGGLSSFTLRTRAICFFFWADIGLPMSHS